MVKIPHGKLAFSWDTEINIKTRIEIKFYVAMLSRYKKRNGAKFVKNLTKHQRFLKGSLRIWFLSGLNYWLTENQLRAPL